MSAPRSATRLSATDSPPSRSKSVSRRSVSANDDEPQVRSPGVSRNHELNRCEPDCSFKITIIGDSGVGKTSLLLRFADDEYQDTQMPTLGVDFRIRTVFIDDKVIRLTIWDTAGQERFRSITQAYFKGAEGIILVYDVTDPVSFDHISEWLTAVDNACGDVRRAPVILVGNKADLADRQVSEKEAEEFAQQNGLLFLETSAKTTTNVEAAFQLLANQVMKHKNHVCSDECRCSKQGFAVEEEEETRENHKKSICDMCRIS